MKVWQLRDALNQLPDDLLIYVSKVGNLSFRYSWDTELIGVINLDDCMEIEFFDGRDYYIRYGRDRPAEVVYDHEDEEDNAVPT